MRIIKTAAVIGAGMAGLTVARHLAANAVSVTLFDKGRSPGGRLSSRASGEFHFNHGCQFATARNPGFAALLASHQAALWPAASHQGAPRWSGTPAMAAIATSLAAGFCGTLHSQTHVSFLTFQPNGWFLTLQNAAATPPGLVEPSGQQSGPYDAVILAIPAPQAAALLGAAGHGFANMLAPVSFAPCWALMLGFAHPQPGENIIKPSSGPLRWVARENSRPGSLPAPVCYTAHASPEWSRENLESSEAAIISDLLGSFSQATGITTPPAHVRAHRWRYALVETPLNQPHLWDPATNLGLCGDWCLTGKLEAAYLSGNSLGIRLFS